MLYIALSLLSWNRHSFHHTIPHIVVLSIFYSRTTDCSIALYTYVQLKSINIININAMLYINVKCNASGFVHMSDIRNYE